MYNLKDIRAISTLLRFTLKITCTRCLDTTLSLISDNVLFEFLDLQTLYIWTVIWIKWIHIIIVFY